MWQQLWPYLVGYCYSMVIAHILIRRLMRLLWGAMVEEYEPEVKHRERYEHHPMMVGFLERCLYTASFQLGRPEFIAVWLAMKVSGHLKSWTDEKVGRSSRTVLNLFLIGNGFSIAYGVVGATLVAWLEKKSLVPAIAVSTALVALNVAFSIWASIERSAAIRQRSLRTEALSEVERGLAGE